MHATEVTRTARRPKNRKAQIALAAAGLFCERGYHLVGVDEIAAAVGISGPAVYRHFPTKYAILVHASRELIAGILAATEVDDVDDDDLGRLDAILGGLARFAVEQRSVGALYQWEYRYLAPEHRAEFRVALATVVERIAGPLRALRPGLSGPTADLLVRAALSTFGSLSTHRAAVSRGRAEQTLRRLGWAMLRADVADPVPTAAVPGKGIGDGEGTGVRTASRHEILLTEAIRLFRRLGYHAVGMDDIGTAAGINASSVYRYFPSKADLLAAAYYRASERLAARKESALNGATDAPEALHRLVDSYVTFSFEQSDLVSVYVSENNNLPDHDRHQLRRTQRLHVEEWVRLLTTVRPGLPAVEARLLVHAALNLVSDLGRAVRFARGAGTEALVTTLAGIGLNA
ncbi:TetR/AcrR family transcriptional regulator [Virgisporangium aurantiacum]|uniref:TetR family transcriptional regulator n=1 Tax=Virgisporangium aurantiacum TaxID=175570 RepID=A0A8J3Z3P1_9ACTN|nr:TetR/AcrR family transcriptional regulator [Virgisporangium aurantiacum]GIJ54425.1 TetR family transcriptional regulator [Virgisporangium aurantiacum]